MTDKLSLSHLAHEAIRIIRESEDTTTNYYDSPFKCLNIIRCHKESPEVIAFFSKAYDYIRDAEDKPKAIDEKLSQFKLTHFISAGTYVKIDGIEQAVDILKIGNHSEYVLREKWTLEMFFDYYASNLESQMIPIGLVSDIKMQKGKTISSSAKFYDSSIKRKLQKGKKKKITQNKDSQRITINKIPPYDEKYEHGLSDW
jgi:hypothetical protein